MIRVLVVEDEAPILRSICSKMESINPIFYIIDTACNGQEALEKLAIRKDIDLAFIDINLPIVNGITVLEFIRQSCPHVMSVVLSGYKDYEFVRKAFGMGAIDYLLKPLKDDELRNLLAKIQERYSANAFRNDADLLEGALRSKADTLQHTERYICILISAGGGEFLKIGNSSSHSMMFEKIPWETLLAEQFGEKCFWLFEGNFLFERIVFVPDRYASSVKSINTITNHLERYALPITITVNRSLLGLDEIYDAYRMMRRFAYENAMFLRSSVQYFTGGQLEFPMSAEQEMADGMVDACKFTALKGILSVVEDLIDVLKNRPLRRISAEYLVKRFFSGLCKKLPGNYSYVDIDERIGQVMRDSRDIEEVTGELRFLVQDCFGAIPLDPSDKKELADAMLSYLKNNYHHSISNKMLSEKFGFVPSYISAIFKEHYGIPPGEYIINLRMGEAKALLLHSGMKVKEISEAVGYQDPLYFSRMFKQTTGVSPREYAENNE